MPVPKPKTDEALDLDDVLDLRRSEIMFKHRMVIRREKNEVYKELEAAVADGRKLSVGSKQPELGAADV